MAEETRVATGQEGNNPGPFLAKVVSHLDSTYMGALEVQLEHVVGNDPGKEGQMRTVRYMSPFAGQTSVDFVGEDETYDNAQKSYGFWMVPPDVGATVVCFFINGDPAKGYWIGCVRDEGMNFMTPGIAATSFAVDSQGFRVPTAEYNKVALPVGNSDSTKNPKARHPLADVLESQGLLKDDIRGITTSSARREVPSHVYGISTPGPLDKRTNAPKATIGKDEHKIPGAPISRLGGTTFVMDDGDDKFLRKKPAGEGPPEYAGIEQDETDGDKTIPHNELVRIRTRTGHQILLHNSEDLIYIGNAKGTTWVELTSNGKIDIYAQDSISIHTENDLNVTADRDINFVAGRNINFNAAENFFMTLGTNYEIKAGGDGKLTVGGQSNIKAGGNHVETAANIHMNGPSAAEAGIAPKAQRIPLHEPWAGHENLDPLSHTLDKTEAVQSPELTEPAFFNQYTTTFDTFAKVKGTED
jgi:hypothetical protein